MFNKRPILLSVICLVFIVLYFSSCLKSKRPGIPKDVISVLDIAGINKPQLTKFILNCMEADDSLKLDACYYLLSYSNKNYTSFYSLKDSLGNTYNINPGRFSNLREILLHIDSLEGANGCLEYKADSFSIDFESLNSKQFTDNLFVAFDTYNNNKEWLTYGYSAFKQYILPYRVANEIVEPFRKKLRGLLNDELDNELSFEQNVLKVNRKINSLIQYDERYVKTMHRPLIDELLETGKGNLETINIFKVKAFRSLGFAAAMDYTPALSDTNGWLAWTTVIAPDGNEIHLGACDGGLTEPIVRSLAKIYRRTYFADSNSLFSIKSIKESTPPYLGHYNYIDVSGLYGNNYRFAKKTSSSQKYLFTAVYNDGKWKAVDWSLNKDSIMIFENMAENVVYLPTKWEDKRCLAIDYPFVFKNGDIQVFKPSLKSGNFDLKYYASGKHLMANIKYKLYYWDNTWKVIGDFKYHVDGISASLPLNAIYLIKDDDIFHDERIFAMEDGNQLFY
ncbi:MAG: hypothetical protein GXO88_14645 [Chlorobi bacterium]|nr:hypothetical protein [Chlorobiota bacterium]